MLLAATMAAAMVTMLALPARAASGIIQTIGGTASSAFNGDGLPFAQTNLNHPYDLAYDGSGNLYVADLDHCRVRRVDHTTSLVSTVAGNGSCGSTGDGGQATLAEMIPSKISFDALGRLYVGDDTHCVIRRVDLTGLISKVAGGSCGYAGDNGPATSAAIYVQDLFVKPDGTMYIDSARGGVQACAIRRVDASTGIITTVAGTGTCSFNNDGVPATSAFIHPYSVVVDSADNIYIADHLNCRIRKVDASTHLISTIAGGQGCAPSGDGGPFGQAGIEFPIGLALDPLGNLYFFDSFTSHVSVGLCTWRRLNFGNGLMERVAGGNQCHFSGDGGPALSAAITFSPHAAFAPDGSMVFSDYDANRVRSVIGVVQSGDTNAPTVSCAPLPPGWSKVNVSISCTVADTGSGLANPADASFVLSTSVTAGAADPNAMTSTRQVCDVTGNCVTAGPLGPIEVDRALPTITWSGDGASFAKGSVQTLDLHCADVGSGVDTCDSAPSVVDTSVVGPHTITAHAMDVAGNSTTVTFTYTVFADTTAPVLTTILDRTVDATSNAGAVVVYVPPTAMDDVDGPLLVTCDHPSGATFPLGSTLVTCRATDSSGNTGSTSFRVTVRFSWSGCLPPVVDGGRYRQGRSLPVKFTLTGGSTGASGVTARLWLARYHDGHLSREIPAKATGQSSSGNTFRFDSASGQYIFNLDTRRMDDGRWRLRVDLGDDVDHICQIHISD